MFQKPDFLSKSGHFCRKMIKNGSKSDNFWRNIEVLPKINFFFYRSVAWNVQMQLSNQKLHVLLDQKFEFRAESSPQSLFWIIYTRNFSIFFSKIFVARNFIFSLNFLLKPDRYSLWFRIWRNAVISLSEPMCFLKIEYDETKQT